MNAEEVPHYEESDFEFLPEENTLKHSEPSQTPSSNVQSSHTPDDIMMRARSYLRQIPGAVQGDHGDQGTYIAAAKMRDFGLSEDECYRLMVEEFNLRCKPPWAEKELREKVSHAYRYAAGIPGNKLDQEWQKPNACLPGKVCSQSETIAEAKPGESAAKKDWESPIPFRQFNLPIFPAKVFPDWLREFVEAEAIATQTPVDLSGMLGLSVLGVACQKKFVVQVKPGWTEPTSIFTATALPSGNRKSADFADMVDPLEEFEEAEAARMAPEIAAAQARFKILESRLHDKQTAASKGKTTDDQAQLEQQAVEMAKEFEQMSVPMTPRLLADDVTPERLTTLIRDQGGRMAVMSPEGDVFELMAGRYTKNGAPNFAVYLKGHSADTLRVDRTNRSSEFVKKPALTVGFAVQPDVIRGLSQKEGFRGRGLLARFLYSLPESLLGRRDPYALEVPDDIRTTYRRNVLALLGLPFAKDEHNNPSANHLTLDHFARTALFGFMADLEPKIAPLGELGSIADWAGKLVGAVVRIAGLLHVALHVNDFEPWIIPIKLETIEKAIQVGQYLIPHARAAFAEMGADPAVEEARHILSWIERKQQPTVTKRDIFEGTKGRFKRADDLNKPINVLIEHEYLRQKAEPERRGPGKPPSPTYEVNPFLWEDSANKANIANDNINSHFTNILFNKKMDEDSASIKNSCVAPTIGSQYSQYSQNESEREEKFDTAGTESTSRDIEWIPYPHNQSFDGDLEYRTGPACRVCGEIERWRRSELGPWICKICHPPVN
jgi:replicative DNA helicase